MNRRETNEEKKSRHVGLAERESTSIDVYKFKERKERRRTERRARTQKKRNETGTQEIEIQNERMDERDRETSSVVTEEPVTYGNYGNF